MNLHLLQQRIREIGDPIVLGFEQKVGEAACGLLGWVRQDQELRLVTLVWEATADACQEEPPGVEDPEGGPSTGWRHRERMLPHLRQERLNPLQHAVEVSLDDRILPVREVTSTRLNPLDWESTALLTLFLRAGWNPERLASAAYDQLVWTSLTLEGTEELPTAALQASRVAFAIRGGGVEHPVGLQMRLAVGEAGEEGSLPPRVTFPDAKPGEDHWMQIERVVLFDPWAQVEEVVSSPAWAERMTPAEREETRSRLLASIAEHCPRGMRIPVIEYECEEGISCRFHALSYLDAIPEPSGNGGAFGIIAGASRETGRSGARLRSSAIETPVPEGTATIEVELFSYRQEIKETRIDFRQ